MPLFELVANLHMHTPYSDGAWYHADIAPAAMAAGLDVICVTDHNVWVDGPARYYEQGGRRVLLLVGEEIHDQTRQPQKNHLLVYGAEKELARCALEPQRLLDAVAEAGGFAFLAHPVDPPAPLFHEPDLSWESWDIHGFTGLELWNYMSAFKGLLTSRANAIRYAFNPELGVLGPFPESLALWDRLLASGRRIVAIANADAHGTEQHMGRLRRTIFPYEFLFRQLNTHLLSDTAFNGDYAHDRALVLDALAKGHCFVGYDAAGPTRGFRLTASAERGAGIMGDEVVNRGGVTLQVAAPASADLRLLRDGAVIAHWENQSHAAYVAPSTEHGVYRVEAHRHFHGRLRGWIYSNPIYVRPA